MGSPDYQGNPKLSVLVSYISKIQRCGCGRQRAVSESCAPRKSPVGPAGAPCSCSPVRGDSVQRVSPPARHLRLQPCLMEQVAAQGHLELSLGLLGAAGGMSPHFKDFGSWSSILVGTCLGRQPAMLSWEPSWPGCRPRSPWHFPGGTEEVAEEGNASLWGCSQLCWSYLSGAQGQVTLPHFCLLLLHCPVLNFAVTCFSCLFLASWSSARIPL